MTVDWIQNFKKLSKIFERYIIRLIHDYIGFSNTQQNVAWVKIGGQA